MRITLLSADVNITYVCSVTIFKDIIFRISCGAGIFLCKKIQENQNEFWIKRLLGKKWYIWFLKSLKRKKTKTLISSWIGKNLYHRYFKFICKALWSLCLRMACSWPSRKFFAVSLPSFVFFFQFQLRVVASELRTERRCYVQSGPTEVIPRGVSLRLALMSRNVASILVASLGMENELP